MELLTRWWDRLADASIYFSFDRTGFRRHARRFDPADLAVDLSGRRVLVTGANSGLGRAAAQALARLGAEVWLLCRSRERGQRALEELREGTGNETARLELVDVSLRASILDFARRLGDLPVYALVNNAGILPTERGLTEDGLERTWATNVVGPHLLTAALVPNLRSARGARVVNVTSGGMYAQKLDISDVDWNERPFDGVAAYAQTKRAEVILTEMWAERLKGDAVDVNAVHPGWADTPAVRTALPRFWRFTRNRLRSPEEGADTIVWLVAAPRLTGTTGGLWFDRRKVSAHAFPWTRESREERRCLWELCQRQAGPEDSS